MPTRYEIYAERPESHPKGARLLLQIGSGAPIPPGVILGKDTRLTVVRIEDYPGYKTFTRLDANGMELTSLTWKDINPNGKYEKPAIIWKNT